MEGDVELASRRLGGVEILDRIHKSLFHLTEYKHPDEKSYNHESNTVSETGCIKTAYPEHGVTEGFYEWGKGIQVDPEP
jgi:hypothetical protein